MLAARVVLATRDAVAKEVRDPRTVALPWAACCKTWSRIRERLIVGHKNPPKPVRSATELWGLKELQDPSRERDRKAVREANEIAE